MIPAQGRNLFGKGPNKTQATCGRPGNEMIILFTGHSRESSKFSIHISLYHSSSGSSIHSSERCKSRAAQPYRSGAGSACCLQYHSPFQVVYSSRMNMRVDGGKKRRVEVPTIVGRPLPDRIGIFDADRRLDCRASACGSPSGSR